MSFFKRLIGDEISVHDGYRALQKKEFQKAFQIWEELARRGDPVAQYNVAKMYSEGLSVGEDQRMAMMYCERSADGGAVKLKLGLGVRGASPVWLR
jgi:uncharacterized protein